MRSTAMFVWIGLTAAAAVAQPPSSADHARARVICEQSALIPGTTGWLGLTFDIDPEWHVYWNGASDTGLPISFGIAAPDGYKVGAALWPAPTRHVTEDFLDHIYAKQVTILIPVAIPASAKAGSLANFKVDAQWLVCKQACLPGSLETSLTIPVAATASPGADAKRFAEARSRVPAPMSPTKPEATVKWKDGGVEFKTTDGAKGLAFYPGLECPAFSELAAKGESTTDTLILMFEKPSAANRLVGVLEIEPQKGGRHTIISIDQARPDSAGPGKETRQPGGG